MSLIFKTPFKCVLCGETEKFYIMPLDKKTISGGVVHSGTDFKIVCQTCGQTYEFYCQIKIE